MTKASGLGAIARAARAASAAAGVATADPLAMMDWVRPQDEFLRCEARTKLLRAGNQVCGKSTVGLAECLFIALGRHPYRSIRPGPKEIWLLCASWPQSVAIQAKLWDLCPKAEVHPSQRFDPVRGFGGHSPALRLKNGSIVRVKTTQQGTLSLAGSSIDHALFDEPPAKQSVYSEVAKRVQAKGGTISLTLTPIGGPVDYLRELVEAGQVTDLHFDLSLDNLRHVKSGRLRVLPDGTTCDQAWVDRVISETLPSEVPVRCHGEWETRPVGRVFEVFDRDKHVSNLAPVGESTILVGVDHGANLAKSKQAMVLVAVQDQPGSTYPKVFVISEWKPPTPGATPPEVDAAALLAMLRRHDLSWSNVDFAHGDKPVGEGASSKGNAQIEAEIAKTIGVRRESLHPRLRSSKRGKGGGAGQVEEGLRYLHNQLVRGNLTISPSCPHLIEAMERWDGTRDSPWKDIIDALRYALIPEIRGYRRKHGQTKINLW